MLTTHEDFDTITDNILKICTPQFNINLVVKNLREKNMLEDANYIQNKLAKTSELFMQFFIKAF